MISSKHRSKIFIAIIVSISFSPLHAQEEITFNNLNVQSNEIQATKTVSGFSFGINPNAIIGQNYFGYLTGSLETHLRYFHENRLGGTFTLNKAIGLVNSNARTTELIIKDDYSAYSGKTVYNYKLGIEVLLEPRWYCDARARYRHNKSILNNTGWFVSIPFTMNMTLLNEPLLGHNNSWTPEPYVLYASLPLGIGYRKAFSDHWMVEGTISQSFFRSYYYDGHFELRSINRIGLFSDEGLNSELKVAYTF